MKGRAHLQKVLPDLVQLDGYGAQGASGSPIFDRNGQVVGIIAALSPVLTEMACTLCEACCDACPDDAISLPAGMEQPRIDAERCLACGRCVPVCPSGTLAEGCRGYKVLLGGKLGRRPRLATEIPGIFSEDEVMDVLSTCLEFYKQHSRKGRRFAELLTPDVLEGFIQTFGKSLPRPGIFS